jgi:hypothetical protein
LAGECVDIDGRQGRRVRGDGGADGDPHRFVCCEVTDF